MGARRALALPQAIALGLLHGPTELLPVSSSAHTTFVPWLAGWHYGELDPELRKAFEVALHAGTAAALLVRPPWASSSCVPGEGGLLTADPGVLSRPRVGARIGFLTAALTPAALTGYTLGGQIERRLGTPATIAVGLIAGSAAIGTTEWYARKGRSTRARGERSFATTTTSIRDPGTGPGPRSGTRTAASADWRDGLALGLAQALALFPGVSRSGATLTAARMRGFSRIDADRLSWDVGLPVITGAAALKGIRLARAGTPTTLRLPLAAGAASALLSTLASTGALTPERRARLLPACAAYRAMLALLVIRRMRDKPARTPSIPKK